MCVYEIQYRLVHNVQGKWHCEFPCSWDEQWWGSCGLLLICLWCLIHLMCLSQLLGGPAPWTIQLFCCCVMAFSAELFVIICLGCMWFSYVQKCIAVKLGWIQILWEKDGWCQGIFIIRNCMIVGYMGHNKTQLILCILFSQNLSHLIFIFWFFIYI